MKTVHRSLENMVSRLIRQICRIIPQKYLLRSRFKGKFLSWLYMLLCMGRWKLWLLLWKIISQIRKRRLNNSSKKTKFHFLRQNSLKLSLYKKSAFITKNLMKVEIWTIQEISWQSLMKIPLKAVITLLRKIIEKIKII